MDAKTFDQSKRPSRHVAEGASRARHRQGTKASRVSSGIIADSIASTRRSRSCKAMMGLPGRDKAPPGAMMSMLRLNMPDVFMHGGSIPPGKCKGRDVRVGLARKGAATQAGGKAEVVCYAKI
jgi:dihydroxy-acid dehydratase